ncbi:MAG TPA: hypothetical protein VMC85_11290 [Desulfomonilaceae bacterium]|nr:hypothetical protein [Desulfomonilaceae bacterium]
MLRTRTTDDAIRIGRHFSVSFQRTLRLPEDGRTYPLPPGLGRFPIHRVADYADRVPESWRRHGGVFIPMYQREALWMAFQGADWRPNAVKIGVGMINALSGHAWNQSLSKDKQDYIVVPEQPWLDGINAGKGLIRQFVAMPLGMGYTVEGQITGREEAGGMQIIVYDPKPGKFPEEEPRWGRRGSDYICCCSQAGPGVEMGLAAGGKMEQKIYPDSYGIDTWDVHTFGRVYVHIVNSMMYREITGSEPPPTPVTAREYTRYGLPWFDLYDQEKATIEESGILTGVKSTGDLDKKLGFLSQQDDAPVDIPATTVKGLHPDEEIVPDGQW